MGAWGTGSFENDDALDFVVRLEHEGETAIRAALEDVTGLGAGGYLEAPDASSAIAAGEVVAAARDGDVSRLPEAAQGWLAGHGDGLATPALLVLAHRAVERVLMQSELKELWEEGDADAQSEAWATGVRQLIARLQATPSNPKAQAPKRRKPRKRFSNPECCCVWTSTITGTPMRACWRAVQSSPFTIAGSPPLRRMFSPSSSGPSCLCSLSTNARAAAIGPRLVRCR